MDVTHSTEAGESSRLAHIRPRRSARLGGVRGLVLVAIALGAVLAPFRAAAAGAPGAALSRHQVEAVFLFNFAQFVGWPADSFDHRQAPLVIGILGQDPFGKVLDEVVRGERVNGRPLVIRRFARGEEIETCHILFISRSETDRLDAVFAALKSRSVLTVSDIKDFAKRGGMIEFVEEKDRIRFRIALQRARAESLQISAKLLRPAEVVFRFPDGYQLVRNFPVPETSDTLFVAKYLAPALVELVHLSLDGEFSVPVLFPR